MSKVLIFGASGLLGTEVLSQLRVAGHDVMAPSHADLDITDANAVGAIFKKEKPRHVLNFAANVDVDSIERDPSAARRLNTDAAASVPELIAEHAPGASYLFMSTSYVFGDSTLPRDESGVASPENEYGRTKVEAEKLIIAASEELQVPYHIIRTSWIYGPHRETFVDHVAQALIKGDIFTAAADQKGNLTNVKDLAQSLAHFIDAKHASGIYHVFNEDRGGVSRLEIAEEIAANLGKTREAIMPGDRAGIFHGGKRPSIILKNTKLPSLRGWREALREYLSLRYSA